MRKFLCIVLLFLCSYESYAALKTWNKTTGGSWATANNWTPSGVPAMGDSIVIPTAQSDSITNVPTLSFSAIMIYGRCAFMAATTGNTLTVTGTYYLAEGVHHTIGVYDYRLNFTIATGAAGFIYGTVNFDGGATEVREFTVNGSLTFGPNGVITDETPDTETSFVMGPSATLIIANPDGISADGSSGAIQLTGPIIYSTTGNYVFNGPGDQQTGDGLPSPVGSLTVGDGTNNTNLTITNPPVTVTGTITINSGDTLNGALIAGGTVINNGTDNGPIMRTKDLSGTYTNLLLSGDTLYTVNTTATVNGTLTIQGNALLQDPITTFGASAGIHYNVTAARTTGEEWPVTFNGTGGVTVSNTGAITLTADKTVGASMIINSGATLIMDQYDISLGGNWTNNGGTLNGGSNILTFTGTTAVISGSATAFPVLTIGNTGIVSMNNSNTAASLVFEAGGSNASLTHASGTTFSTTGAVTLNQPTTSTRTKAWNINDNTVTCGGLITFAGNNNTVSRITTIVITTGTLNANGGMTFVGSASATKVINMSGGAGKINFKGTLTVPGNSSTLTAGTAGSTFNYCGTSAQTIEFFTAGAYYNLEINNTATAALSGNLTATNVTGDLIVTTGTFSNGTRTVTGNASRTLSVASGATLLLTGGTTFPTGFGTFSLDANSTVEYGGTNNQNITTRTYPHLTLSGGGNKVPQTGTLIITGNLLISSGATMQANTNNVPINLAGNFTNNGTFTTGTGVFTFNGATQTISGSSAVTLHILTISSSVSTTLQTNISIRNTTGAILTVSSGATFDLSTFTCNRAGTTGTRTLTVSGTLKLGSNTGGQTGSNFPTNFSPVTLTGGTVEYNAVNSLTQTVFATSYHNLTLTNGSGTGMANKISTASFDVSSSFLINAKVKFTPAAANIISGTGTMSGMGVAMVTHASGVLTTQYTLGINHTDLYIGYPDLAILPAGTYNNLYIVRTGGGTQTLGGNITVSGNIYTESGTTLHTSASNYSISVGKNWINDGTFTGGTGTVTLNGTTTQQILGTSTTTFNNLTVSNTSAYINPAVNMNVTGTMNLLTGATMNPDVNVQINSGGNNGTLTGNGTLMVTRTAGSDQFKGQYKFTTYTLNNITVNFNSTAAQDISSNTSYGNIIISGSRGSNNFTLGSGITINVSGILDNTATFSTGNVVANSGNTVNYNASGAQSVENLSYANLTTSGSGAKTMAGNSSVSGALNLGSGTTLSTGTYELTVASTMSGPGTITAGTGTVTLAGSGAQQVPAGIFTSNIVNNLKVNNAAGVTLNGTTNLTGTLTPMSGILTTGGFLKLVSDAVGTARIAAGTGAYISGDVIAERYIPAVGRKWRFMSSPVSGRTLADWQQEIFITGTGGSTNGFDVALSNPASVYNYNEALITGDMNTGWTAATNITNPIETGRGYRVFIRGDRSDLGRLTGTEPTQNPVTMNVIGPVHTGNISLPVSYTSSGNAANDGWCLVGNPYPSAIDWNAFHDAGRTGSPDFSGTDYSHIDAVISIYDPTANNYSSYNAFSNIGTGPLSGGVIPSGAAFLLQATALSPSLTMKETYKTGTIVSGLFKTNTPTHFTVTLSRDKGHSDEAIIKYVNEATPAFDHYDIAKLSGSDINISSVAGDSRLLTVNCKPFDGNDDIIPLNIGAATSGSYQLSFANTDALVEALPITLIDKYTQKSVNLRTNDTYAFTIDKSNNATFGSERFIIVIGNVITALNDISNKGAVRNSSTISLYPTITSGPIAVSNAVAGNDLISLAVTDVMGRELTAIENITWNNGKVQLDVSSYTPGVYYITITQGSEHSTLRFIKE
jgi:hypothetical protein